MYHCMLLLSIISPPAFGVYVMRGCFISTIIFRMFLFHVYFYLLSIVLPGTVVQSKLFIATYIPLTYMVFIVAISSAIMMCKGFSLYLFLSPQPIHCI